MAEAAPAGHAGAEAELRAEVARLGKMVQVLMDREERGNSCQSSDFGLFQSAILLEQQVRQRTAELESALRENERITRALRASEARFRGVVGQSLVGIAITDGNRFTYVNPKFAAIFGHDEAAFTGLRPQDLVLRADWAPVARRLSRHPELPDGRFDFLFRGRRRDGGVIHVEVHSNAVSLAGQRSVVSVVLDVTERVRTEQRLREAQARLQAQSVTDALTGLFNRRYLAATLPRELAAARRRGQGVGVIMVDIDHFKAVNDSHGHLAGDGVLRAVAGILARRTRAGDVACRYGGEEFLLVLPGMPLQEAARRAEQLRAEVAAARIDLGPSVLQVTASFGVAAFPGHGDSLDTLAGAADRALYAAKAAGRDRVCVADPL
jgi:diguanylate cyclase (GGDEF)-like protein/PAS domain S-box-containing protein